MSNNDSIDVWVRLLPSKPEPFTTEDGREWLAARFKANIFTHRLFDVDEKNLTRDWDIAIVLGERPDAEAISNQLILKMTTKKARELAQAILATVDPDRN
jgi:hypothetical protein